MRQVNNEVIDDDIIIEKSIVPSIQIDLSDVQTIQKPASDLDFMNMVDLTYINYYGGIETSEQEYEEELRNIEYWASIILGGD